MRNHFLSLVFFNTFFSTCILAQEPVSLNADIVCVQGLNDSVICHIVNTDQLYSAGMDTLPQVIFWRKVMNLSPDTALISLAYQRKIFGSIPVADWDQLGKDGQDHMRDSIRNRYCYSDSTSILYTKGKNDFYDVHAVIPQIDRAIPIFVQQGVDPFYAQAILLIESPGKNMKSYAGANGPFQLMKSVAIKMGLTVNRKVDERNDFDKSASAAARMIQTICIPYTNAMLDARGICYDPNDLWYRLLVLHVYHAGPGNVAKALDAICPTDGGMWLIKQLWQTKAGQFGNSSQSYSQLAVAALLELDEALGRNAVSATGKDDGSGTH